MKIQWHKNCNILIMTLSCQSIMCISES